MNKLLIISAIVMIALLAIGMTGQVDQAQSQLKQAQQQALEDDINAALSKSRISPGGLRGIDTGPSDAPIVISGENTYIVWWSNRTGNDEVNFRASTDGGATFADKIKLSNSTDADSQDVEIAAEGDNVIISWWERNQTAEEPVARVSSDDGATFGPLLRLATNGTIG
jgi:hypothetical protein